MNMAGDDRVQRLVSQFTWLRQTGVSREDAWAGMQVDVMALAQVERNRLLSLLRGWEAKEGQVYRAAQPNDPFETLFTPPEGLREMRQQMNSNSSSLSASKGIRRIQPIASQPEAAEVECPGCHRMNPSGLQKCTSCGTLLAWGDVHSRKDDTQPLGMLAGEDARFTENMVLYLSVVGSSGVIRVRPGTSEMIIGRRSPDSVMIPDVDLSPYGADIKGVSRLHAGLRRHGQTLVITDMGSLNHSYVNNQRLHPHEVRVLHDADELRFGQLTVQVRFENE
ncbi:MAG: FHA domain-containing protein [Chloroflexi bacterium]|nr:FHA domain-containing protein [Chloroflexota bacterium]